MDRQPHLTGATLALRPLRVEDWQVLYAVACDPLIWEQHPAHDRWQEPVFRGFFAEALASGGTIVVIERASGAIIGSSRWHGFDPTDGGRVEIGWTFLARAHWGGRTNRELKQLMLTHAFGWVERVIFRIGEANTRSRIACERIGAVLLADTDEAMMGGRLVRHVHYALTREAFAAGPLMTAAAYTKLY